MNDFLQEALAGAPVTVTLGRETYPLAYPIEGVILYKSETARLDRERKQGRPALPREEKRALRDDRRSLLAEADSLRPAPGEKWNDDNFARFDELFTEALGIKARLDEEEAAGDSLYEKSNWWKISPEGDPERMRLALWVGLHRFVPGNIHDLNAGKPVYTPRLHRHELGALITLANGEELTVAISKALRAHLIAPPEVAQEEANPNGHSAEIPPPAPTHPTPEEMKNGIVLKSA